MDFEAALPGKRFATVFATKLRRFAAFETFVRVETGFVFVASFALYAHVVISHVINVVICNLQPLVITPFKERWGVLPLCRTAPKKKIKLFINL